MKKNLKIFFHAESIFYTPELITESEVFCWVFTNIAVRKLNISQNFVFLHKNNHICDTRVCFHVKVLQ